MARSKDKASFDVVEKALLGVTPDDPIAQVPDGGARSDKRAMQLTAAKEYLETQPELLAEWTQQIAQAWRTAAGDREKFLNGIAEQRARVLSLAAIQASGQQVQQTAADFQSELSRYLIEREGAGGEGVAV